MIEWENIVEAEPKLLEIEKWAKNQSDDDWHFSYLTLKKKLTPVVGWHRKVPGDVSQKKFLIDQMPPEQKLLFTSLAWDIAIEHLEGILPARCPAD